MNENVNDEDIEDEHVEIEVDDEVELIFPYEVEGDQTPPPRDESSDSEPPNAESSDSKSEDEEIEVALKVDVAPEATIRISTQKPYAIHDFPRGLYEVGESSSARDSSYVGGLEPWALRHDLEATRTRARLIKAEVGTNRTETALLDSKIKIGEKERKILDHDLGNVEKTLSNVVERLKILESGENATLKKKLEDTEMQLVIARMDCASMERFLSRPLMRKMMDVQGRSQRSRTGMMDLLSHGDHLVTLTGGDEAGGAGAGGGASGAGADL
ncbi:hypothetical protein Tco_0469324 [Tanacetum coccineum]